MVPVVSSRFLQSIIYRNLRVNLTKVSRMAIKITNPLHSFSTKTQGGLNLKHQWNFISSNTRVPLNFPKQSFTALGRVLFVFHKTFPTSPYFTKEKVMFLATAVTIATTIGINERIETDLPTRIKLLLSEKAEKRTSDERIEIYDYLLTCGKEEALKAKNKDVVIVFGNTGAGKSTLINFLSGCKITKDKNDNIVVDPGSKIKEVAKIGTTPTSCTFLPKKIPDISFTAEGETDERVLTFYDMPGLADNRGIELTLANVVLLREIVQAARSVRFVFVFEYAQISAGRGVAWKEAVKMLQEGFCNIFGKENSLCVIVTKHDNHDLAKIRREIKGFSDDICDLSVCAITYNPLDSSKKSECLKTIYKTTAYKKIDNQVVLGNAQYFEAIKLGEEIQKSIEPIDNKKMDIVLKKVQFTHSIANLGKDFRYIHEMACKPIQAHLEIILRDIEPAPNIQLNQNHLHSFEQYQALKKAFGPYMKFEKFDLRVNRIVEKVKDPRAIAWSQGSTSLTLGTITGGLLIGSIFFPPLFFVAIPVAGSTIKAIANWLSPSDVDKKMDSYLQGIGMP
jgi:energy-coupling factor transporter ATP-binding protein EcfA2